LETEGKNLSIRKSGHSSASDDKLVEVVYLEVRCYSKETNLKKEIKKKKKRCHGMVIHIGTKIRKQGDPEVR